MRTQKIVLFISFMYLPIYAAEIVQSERALCNLSDSTTIVFDLLRNGRLKDILQAHSPEELDRLTKNYSPALIAFEAEVLSCTLPVLLYFYRTTDMHKEAVDAFMEQLAQSYSGTIKFVALDAEEFFSLAQAAGIAETPSFSMCRNRVVEGCVTGSESIAKISALLQQ